MFLHDCHFFSDPFNFLLPLPLFLSGLFDFIEEVVSFHLEPSKALSEAVEFILDLLGAQIIAFQSIVLLRQHQILPKLCQNLPFPAQPPSICGNSIWLALRPLIAWWRSLWSFAPYLLLSIWPCSIHPSTLQHTSRLSLSSPPCFWVSFGSFSWSSESTPGWRSRRWSPPFRSPTSLSSPASSPSLPPSTPPPTASPGSSESASLPALYSLPPASSDPHSPPSTCPSHSFAT